jgi:hypothetical protein
VGHDDTQNPTNGPGRAVLTWTLGALRARPWTVLDILAMLYKQGSGVQSPNFTPRGYTAADIMPGGRVRQRQLYDSPG